MQPTLRQLEYVVALAEELNFRRAAERCSVSQPGLSTQLQQLESLLGVTLFERDRRHVLLTPAGRDVAERARKVLADAQSLVDAAQSHREPLRGKLHIGVIPTLAPYVLPRALPRVREKYPELRLLLREATTEQLVELARDGELDLLLLALDADLSDLETLHLFDDPFLLTAPQDHELAGRETIEEEALKDEEVLLLDDGH